MMASVVWSGWACPQTKSRARIEFQVKSPIVETSLGSMQHLIMWTPRDNVMRDVDTARELLKRWQVDQTGCTISLVVAAVLPVLGLWRIKPPPSRHGLSSRH